MAEEKKITVDWTTPDGTIVKVTGTPEQIQHFVGVADTFESKSAEQENSAPETPAESVSAEQEDDEEPSVEECGKQASRIYAVMALLENIIFHTAGPLGVPIQLLAGWTAGMVAHTVGAPVEEAQAYVLEGYRMDSESEEEAKKAEK